MIYIWWVRWCATGGEIYGPCAILDKTNVRLYTDTLAPIRGLHNGVDIIYAPKCQSALSKLVHPLGLGVVRLRLS